MAGTDSRQDPTTVAGPSIVLVEPQLGENVGAAARAMLNCGLGDLRLVRPRRPWPSRKARAAASGADSVLDAARVFESVSAAVADLEAVYASTARRRDMVKPVLSADQAAAEMRADEAAGRPSGVLFGPERTGLENDDVVRARAIVTVDLNPGFSSLNLAQAVLLVGWSWWKAALPERRGPEEPTRASRWATAAELENFFEHLEEQLDVTGFLRPPEKRPAMVRNLRNLFTRGGLTEQEVRTLHGIVSALSGRRKGQR